MRAPLDTPAFLDHEGIELLLMPAPEGERVEVKLPPDDGVDVFADLGLSEDDVPAEPLRDSEWR